MKTGCEPLIRIRKVKRYGFMVWRVLCTQHQADAHTMYSQGHAMAWGDMHVFHEHGCHWTPLRKVG